MPRLVSGSHGNNSVGMIGSGTTSYHDWWVLLRLALLFLFLVVSYRRYIAQCRLKSVGFTTSRKINSFRVLRK